MNDVKAAAGGLGFKFAPVEIRRAEDIEPAFAGLSDRADALYVCGSDAMINTNRLRINTLAVGAHLPTLHTLRVYVEAGGLMSYGPVIPEMFKRAAELVDKILHGAKPTDIPVEQPTKFELLVNLTTAKAIGITIPESFLALANQVID
jgi:putative ABC transport system substrate-binding protein